VIVQLNGPARRPADDPGFEVLRRIDELPYPPSRFPHTRSLLSIVGELPGDRQELRGAHLDCIGHSIEMASGIGDLGGAEVLPYRVSWCGLGGRGVMTSGWSILRGLLWR
jgi:hypothetical protein